LKPNNPTALISPATKASTNAPYSTHRGNFEITMFLKLLAPI
ncbi:MAG: hypothetical protein ACJA2G_002454, partial [Cognaticolwellia sp.]